MNTFNIPFTIPDITDEEINEVVDTLKSGWITTGPKTKLLEKKLAEYCHTNRMICLSSATACEEMALRVLGIGPGDEVITSAYTFTASASVICHVGAKVVLVDTAKDSFEMDYDQLEKAINEHTKAIIPVDIAGIMCDYERIFQIVENKKKLFKPSNAIQEGLGRIAVVADSAHALGAQQNGKMCGEVADFTSFSFHAVKNYTTAEGGGLTWRSIEGIDDEKIYKEVRLLTLHGQSRDAYEKMQLGMWEYDIIAPYYKYNMTDIHASLGLAQLKRYPSLLKKRRQIINRYNEAFKNIPISVLKHYGDNFSSSGHLYFTRIFNANRNQCNKIMLEMAEKGIGTNVHYKPLPMLTAYKNLGFRIDDYPNAYKMYNNEITLPLHTKLSDEQIAYVIEVFSKIVLNL